MVVGVFVVYPGDGVADRELRPLPLTSVTREDCTALSLAQEEIKIQNLKYSICTIIKSKNLKLSHHKLKLSVI